jgi:hypothetical protein
MRPKFVIGVLLCALGLIGMLFIVRLWRSTATPNPAAPSQHATQAAEIVPAIETVPVKANVPSITNRSTVPDRNDPAYPEYVRRRRSELDKMAAKGDATSRDAILAELKNPDKEIRAAALDAAAQLDDPSVASRLTQIAAETEDPIEKAEILKTADFVSQPSLGETVRQRRAERASLGLTNPPLSQKVLQRNPLYQKKLQQSEASPPASP